MYWQSAVPRGASDVSLTLKLSPPEVLLSIDAVDIFLPWEVKSLMLLWEATESNLLH